MHEASTQSNKQNHINYPHKTRTTATSTTTATTTTRPTKSTTAAAVTATTTRATVTAMDDVKPQPRTHDREWHLLPRRVGHSLALVIVLAWTSTGLQLS